MYSPFLYNRVKEFVKKYGDGIVKSIKGTGLFFPAVIGQSALESGYGEKIPLNSILILIKLFISYYNISILL